MIYDCKTNSYNLSNLEYSLLGFTVPTVILVQHHDKANNNFISFDMFMKKILKKAFLMQVVMIYHIF